jgi:ABC-type lipopolysaccharide export system ATPase subunit
MEIDMTEFEKLQELTLKSIIVLIERMQAQDEEIDRLKEEYRKLLSKYEVQRIHRDKAEKSAARERLKYKLLSQQILEKSQRVKESQS